MVTNINNAIKYTLSCTLVEYRGPLFIVNSGEMYETQLTQKSLSNQVDFREIVSLLLVVTI